MQKSVTEVQKSLKTVQKSVTTEESIKYDCKMGVQIFLTKQTNMVGEI